MPWVNGRPPKDAFYDEFREKYLNAHHVYMKSIADTAAYFFFDERYNAVTTDSISCVNTLAKLPIAHSFPLSLSPSTNRRALRHLRNAWYDELALAYPEEDDSRMKFAAWKINQFYYCVYESVAALVRCIRSDGVIGHQKTLNIYTSELLASRRFRRYFQQPISTYLDQHGRLKNTEQLEKWGSFKSEKRLWVQRCLESAHVARQRTSLLHYFKLLREWATYEDAYLLLQLYGETIKQALDYCLRMLAFFYLIHSEFFLIRAFGWPSVRGEFEQFSSHLNKSLS